MLVSPVTKTEFRLIRSHRQTSGVRLGTPAGTTRGFGNDEFVKIGHLIGDVLDGLAQNAENNTAVEARVREDVRTLCRAFPIYQ